MSDFYNLICQRIFVLIQKEKKKCNMVNVTKSTWWAARINLQLTYNFDLKFQLEIPKFLINSDI